MVSDDERAAVSNLARDPNARVMVFVDGQNLYKSCKEHFGHPLCHPRLLGDLLAGPRTNHRISVRFYTGRPDPDESRGEALKARNLDRRLAGMRATGVTVVTRKLRYHWTWAADPSLQLPQPNAELAPRVVEMRPWKRPQEKGIDTALALDVIEFVVTGACDVVIIVSRDRDLFEIPKTLGQLRPLLNRPLRVEAAVPVGSDERGPVTLTGFQYTHQITPDAFALIRDDTDYTVNAEDWKQPEHPASLADHRERLATRGAGAKAPAEFDQLLRLQDRFNADRLGGRP